VISRLRKVCVLLKHKHLCDAPTVSLLLLFLFLVEKLLMCHAVLSEDLVRVNFVRGHLASVVDLPEFLVDVGVLDLVPRFLGVLSFSSTYYK
jgi:hypothetical protein